VKKAVNDAFLYDPRVNSYDIEVSVDNGVVTLSGVVDNLKAKKVAEKDARNTVGVLVVDNEIEVRPDKPITDELISEHVSKELRWDPVVERHEITVLARNRKVYLYGNVDNGFEKSRAENIASGVFGVVDVENNLQISKEWEWKSGEEIKDDIETELFWSIFVDSDDIQVFVDDGVVDLYGTVTTWGEVKAAVNNAYEGGAKKVRNHLKMKGYKAFPPYYYYHN